MKLMKNIDLTNKVQSILGDDVDYAYSTRYKNDINDDGLYQNYTIEPSDSRPVFVKMKNGNMFIIWASEWGGITKVDNENNIPASG